MSGPLDAFAAADPDASVFRAAYLRRRDEILAVPESTIARLNVDIQVAVTTARAAWPKLVLERPRMERAFRDLDLRTIDALDDYALATGHLHSVVLFVGRPENEARALRERASRLRNGLLADARTLARHGFVDARRFTEMRGGPGYRNAVFELLGLVNVFREAWPTVASRTALRVETLVEAEELANRLSLAIGARERAPEAIAAATRERQQAFTLMTRAYDLARNAVRYLHPNDGELERIAPSIYAGRSRRKRPARDVPDDVTSMASTTPTVMGPSEAPTSAPATPAPPPLLATLVRRDQIDIVEKDSEGATTIHSGPPARERRPPLKRRRYQRRLKKFQSH